jgi:hypothetical protein
MDKDILKTGLSLPIASVLLFNLAAGLLGLYRYSYDAYTHVFFASHYMKDWLNLWEPRWYGGFPVTSYPPFVHQLMALIGFLNGDSAFGVEAAYQIICVVSAVMFVFSMYKATSIFLDKSEAKYVAVIASLLPSLYLTLYVYGQLPTIFASSLSFLAAYTFHNFLSHGKPIDLAYTSLVSVLVASSHHFTFVFFFPLVLFLTLLMSVIKGRVSLREVSKRSILAFIVSAVLVLIVMMPFFEFVIKNPFQAEIPHATRGNIFADQSHSLLFFWGVYGFTVALIPVGFLIARRRTELLPLFASFIFLFVMGLGGVTPIPKLILGELWYVLTYDRFAIWASFLFTFFLGVVLKDADRIVGKYYPPRDGMNLPKLDEKKLKVTLVIGLAASSVFTMSLDLFITPAPIPEDVLEEVAGFLEENGDYRYVTFGFGPSFMKLSTICSVGTVDGGYSSARRLQVFVDSGVERVDNAKFFPNGTNFLDALLCKDQSDMLGIKWAILADESYASLLEKHGYNKMDMTLERDSSIEIWGRDYVNVTEIQVRETFSVYEVAVWSFGPISALVSVLVLYVGGLIWYHGKSENR